MLWDSRPGQVVFESCPRVQLLLNLNWFKQLLLLFPSADIYLQASSDAAEEVSHDELLQGTGTVQTIRK